MLQGTCKNYEYVFVFVIFTKMKKSGDKWYFFPSNEVE